MTKTRLVLTVSTMMTVAACTPNSTPRKVPQPTIPALGQGSLNCGSTFSDVDLCGFAHGSDALVVARVDEVALSETPIGWNGQLLQSKPDCEAVYPALRLDLTVTETLAGSAPEHVVVSFGYTAAMTSMKPLWGPELTTEGKVDWGPIDEGFQPGQVLVLPLFHLEEFGISTPVFGPIGQVLDGFVVYAEPLNECSFYDPAEMRGASLEAVRSTLSSCSADMSTAGAARAATASDYLSGAEHWVAADCSDPIEDGATSDECSGDEECGAGMVCHRNRCEVEDDLGVGDWCSMEDPEVNDCRVGLVCVENACQHP